jgi:hypothetical protein
MTSRLRLIVIAAMLAVIFTAWPALAGEYTNERYGFSLEYPDKYSLDASSEMHFTLRDSKGRAVLTGEVEDISLYPRDLYEGYKDPFREFGTWRAVLRCDADGPDGSAYCPALKSSREFTTPGGLRAMELMLMHVQESFGKSPKLEETVTGPLYLVDLTREGHTAVLMLGILPYKMMTEKQKEIANSILDSIEIAR